MHDSACPAPWGSAQKTSALQKRKRTKIRNPNHEIRNKTRRPKFECLKRELLSLWHSIFEIVSDFDIRVSNFRLGFIKTRTPLRIKKKEENSRAGLAPKLASGRKKYYNRMVTGSNGG
jgi:hypothetical protein